MANGGEDLSAMPRFLDPQKRYMFGMFRLFDETDGAEGMDYERTDASDHPYIRSKMAYDPVVGLWAAHADGGHPDNTDNRKLWYNFKQCAKEYKSIVPVDWRKDTASMWNYVDLQQREFQNKYSYVLQNGSKRVLGKGAFGTVYLATSQKDNSQVAIKIPSGIVKMKMAKKAIDDSQLEIGLWKKLSAFPYILSLLDHFVIKHNEFPVLVTVTPYIEHGTLHNYLFDVHTKGVPNHEAWLISKQLMMAAKFMHGHNIVHRDIKPDNVLIEKTPEGDLLKILIIDLGTARRFAKKHEKSASVRGTPFFMAPEMKENHDWELEKLDVYSVGRTVLVTTLGYNPLGKGDWEKLWDDKQVFERFGNKALVQVADKMIAKEPSVRCSLPDALTSVAKACPAECSDRITVLQHTELKKAMLSILKQEKMSWVTEYLEHKDNSSAISADAVIAAKQQLLQAQRSLDAALIGEEPPVIAAVVSGVDTLD